MLFAVTMSSLIMLNEKQGAEVSDSETNSAQAQRSKIEVIQLIK